MASQPLAIRLDEGRMRLQALTERYPDLELAALSREADECPASGTLDPVLLELDAPSSADRLADVLGGLACRLLP